jgi:hypothetical protein
MSFSLKYNCDVFYSEQVQEEAFYVCDIGDIVRKHKEWKLKLPRVEPHYGKTLSHIIFYVLLSILMKCIMMSCVSLYTHVLSLKLFHEFL